MEPAERVKVLGNIQFDEDGHAIKVAEPSLKYLYRIQMPIKKAQNNEKASDIFTYIGQSKSRIPKERILQHITNAYGLPHPYTVFKEYDEEKGQPLYIRNGSDNIQDNERLKEKLGEEGACNANFNIIEIPSLRNIEDGGKDCHERGNVRHFDYLEMIAIYLGLQSYHDFLFNQALKGGRVKGNQSNVFKPKISYLKNKIGNTLHIGNKLKMKDAFAADNVAKYTLRLRTSNDNTSNKIHEEIQWYKLEDPCDIFLKYELPKVLTGDMNELCQICNTQELEDLFKQLFPDKKIGKKTKKDLQQAIIQTQAFADVMATLVINKLKQGLPTHSSNLMIVNDEITSVGKGKGSTAVLKLKLELDYKNKNLIPKGYTQASKFLQGHDSQEGSVTPLNKVIKAEYFGGLVKLYDDKVSPKIGKKRDTMHEFFKHGRFSSAEGQDPEDGITFYDQFMDLMNRTTYGPLKFDPIIHKDNEPEFMVKKDYTFTRTSRPKNVGGYITTDDKTTMIKNQIDTLDNITVG